MKFTCLTVVCLTAIFATTAAAELAPVKVEGNKLTADGKEIRFRGINWGWWDFHNTRYTEEDMHQQANWGANAVRLAVFYTSIATENGALKEAGISKVDEVVRWARKYHQYVILDMHKTPGKKGDLELQLWTNKEAQQKYIGLWVELAKRYRDDSTVAAYEIINEPRTTPLTPSLVESLNRVTVAAIRQIDPDKVIVISGDDDSQCPHLLDSVKLDAPNILYTVHFYEGAMGDGWLYNVGDARDAGISGACDWTYFEVPFSTPESVTKMSFLLRSEETNGDAYFDDVALSDENGNVLQHSSFDRGAEGFSIEHPNGASVEYDPAQGHNDPGCLRISKAARQSGWIGPRWNVCPRRSYRISGWIKLNGATGHAYIAAAIYGSPLPEKESLRKALKIPADFSIKYNVPVLVGEFSVVRDVGLEGVQAAEIEKRIRLFEDLGFSWAYWNFHETTNPNTMALQAQKKDGENYPINESLLNALKKGWALNSK